MQNKLTKERAVVLRSLASGSKSWSQLRMAYYGPARAESKASTSFVNQLMRMQMLELIVKTVSGYEITDKGRDLLKTADSLAVATMKTEAQLKTEMQCKHPIVDAYGVCISCRRKL